MLLQDTRAALIATLQGSLSKRTAEVSSLADKIQTMEREVIVINLAELVSLERADRRNRRKLSDFMPPKRK